MLATLLKDSFCKNCHWTQLHAWTLSTYGGVRLSFPIITKTMESKAEKPLIFATAAFVFTLVENTAAIASRYPMARLNQITMWPPCSAAGGMVVMFRRQAVIRHSEKVMWLLAPAALRLWTSLAISSLLCASSFGSISHQDEFSNRFVCLGLESRRWKDCA